MTNVTPLVAPMTPADLSPDVSILLTTYSHMKNLPQAMHDGVLDCLLWAATYADQLPADTFATLFNREPHGQAEELFIAHFRKLPNPLYKKLVRGQDLPNGLEDIVNHAEGFLKAVPELLGKIDQSATAGELNFSQLRRQVEPVAAEPKLRHRPRFPAGQPTVGHALKVEPSDLILARPVAISTAVLPVKTL